MPLGKKNNMINRKFPFMGNFFVIKDPIIMKCLTNSNINGVIILYKLCTQNNVRT